MIVTVFFLTFIHYVRSNLQTDFGLNVFTSLEIP